jgi:hypothetical protein
LVQVRLLTAAFLVACSGAVDGCAPFGADVGDDPQSEVKTSRPSSETELPGADVALEPWLPEPTADPDPPAAVGPEPATMLSPSHPSGALIYQRPIDWTIAAVDPRTPIRYTTDGSTPTPSSALAFGAVHLAEQPGGPIRWIAGDSSVVHTFTVGVQPGLSSGNHAIVENVRFTGATAPLIKVAPGASVEGRADVTVWSNAGCPGCLQQVVLGIGDRRLVCLYQGMPGLHPGAQAVGTFKLKAPPTRGTYRVRMASAQEYTCDGALAQRKPLDETEVAQIIVE